MPTIRVEDLTPFGRLALKLDQEFAELGRIAGELSRVDADSDRGLDDGAKLLQRAGASGEVIAGAMQEFAAALQDARDKGDAAMKLVAERALLLQKRRQGEDELLRRLDELKAQVQAAGAGLAGAQKGPLTEDDKRRVAAELERMLAPMARFVEAARAVKADAARSRFRRVERQADSVIDSLEASRRKISEAIDPK